MKDSDFPLIITERLMLRKFDINDAGEVQRMAGDIEVASNTLNIPHPYTDGLAEEWIRSQETEFHSGKSLVFAICLKESGHLVGAIGLTLQLNYQLAELGYWIGKEYWNKGYCTEAVKSIIGFGFKEFKLHKIYATYFTNNPASGRVMGKAGMHFEAMFKSHLYHWGEYKNLNYFCIFSDENKSMI